MRATAQFRAQTGLAMSQSGNSTNCMKSPIDTPSWRLVMFSFCSAISNMSRKNLAVFCAAMALAACQQGATPTPAPVETSAPDPVGRYQMMRAQGGDGTMIYVLDTQQGTIVNCMIPPTTMIAECNPPVGAK